MGVWIEISTSLSAKSLRTVTPFMGVWIEITAFRVRRVALESHPLWVCGLKYILQVKKFNLSCHTLYGCVD